MTNSEPTLKYNSKAPSGILSERLPVSRRPCSKDPLLLFLEDPFYPIAKLSARIRAIKEKEGGE